jgi:transcriptional regulator with XRE-family HTH domain
MLKLSETCKIKRQAMGLTQAEFAKKVGVTSGTISNFECGFEVSDVIVKNIRFTLRDLESKLTDEELGPYKLRVSVEMAILEQDDKLKQEKLRSVLFSALKYADNLAKKERGIINY